MKIVKYTLNADGTIPTYILDGGYLPVANNNLSPQDWDLIGKATDDAPGTSFATKADLIAYANDNDIIFKNLIADEEISVEVAIDSLWNRLNS